MKVIFLEDVPKVAQAGETKEVANGYGRNFLIPRKLAVLANSAASGIVEAQLKMRARRQAQTEAEMMELAKQLESMKKGMVGETVEELVQKAIQVKGIRIVRHIESEDMKHLVSMAKELIRQSKVVALLGSDEQGAKIVVARSADLDLDCRPLIKDAMAVVGGSGGGKPDFAQGGGQDASKLEEALNGLVSAVKEALEKE